MSAYQVIRATDPALLSIEEEIAAARNTPAMWEELTDPNVWIGIWGPAIHSVAGLGVGAVPVLHGLKRSGKSTCMYATRTCRWCSTGTAAPWVSFIDSHFKCDPHSWVTR
jgi:hypothetical protein